MDFNEIPNLEKAEISMEGEKITIETIINKKVAFLDIEVYPSAFYEGSSFASIQILNESNQKQWFRTSSAVLIGQLRSMKEKKELPKKAVIKKVKRYFTLAPE